MRAWLRQQAIALNSSYWFIPASMTIAALLLSFVTYALDVRLGPDWVSDLWWVHAAKPDGARSLLSSIAGGMLGVAGTVFSITIAAVVYASGNYGPRLLTNFMTDRGNQVSLGVFIADFVYSLMVLRTIRQPDEAGGGSTGFVPELSLLVALGMTVIAIGVLVYFLHHVPDSIRINNVVGAIGRAAIDQIEQRYPDADTGTTLDRRGAAHGWPVTAGTAGYVQVMDFTTLRRLAGEQDRTIRLAIRSGDFVHRDTVLMHVSGDHDAAAERRLRRAFGFGNDRTSSQDIEYLLDELVEIALRALSPGINDPFTAITCLHWLSAATAMLAQRDLGNDPDGHRYGDGAVFAKPDGFDHFVGRGFGTVRASAASNDVAALIFVEAVAAAGLVCPDAGRRAVLHREVRLLLDQAQSALDGPALEELRQRVAAYQQAQATEGDGAPTPRA